MKIPHVPFYFVRHGQTDWNKTNQALCSNDDIPLNQTGLLQATIASNQLASLNITKIYSSPLERAHQTAKIIDNRINVGVELHQGLGRILPEIVASAFVQILEEYSQTLLIVSHGEVYRVLLNILNANAAHPNAKNGGLYFFSPPDSHSDQWIVVALEPNDEQKTLSN